MKAGHVIYSDMTECEFVSAHECLSKVWQLDFPSPPENHVIGVTPEVLGWNGIIIQPHHHFVDVDLSEYDLLVVPGGWASRTVRYNADFVSWLKTWDRQKTIAACCSGALILAEAGFLSGKRATTHTLALETLGKYECVEVRKERVIEDGNVITAGGIMAAYDLGLYLVEKFWGEEARRAVAHQDEYRDVQKDPRTKDLLPELDTWYRGGHLAPTKRPAEWYLPSPR